MIRNIMLKNFLMNTVFGGFTVLNRMVKKDDKQILIYSDTSFRDNSRYLYMYLVEKGYDQRYVITCACKDYKKYRENGGKHIRFVSPYAGIWHYLFSGHVFYSFGRIPIRPSGGQIVIQMWHGTSFKGFSENHKKTNSMKMQFYTYVYASSAFFVPIVENKFQVNRDRIVICGHPRTDVFYRDSLTCLQKEYHKTIIWLPTFRKSKTLGLEDVRTDSVIPVVKNSELKILDAYLERKNVKLFVKLHPAQDIHNVKVRAMKYLDIMTNDEFVKRQYDLYSLMRDTDALITDYSSVFYDYLLLDHPIGFTCDDEEEYRDHRGFAVDEPETFRPGERIKTFDGLIGFIDDICEERDNYAAERAYVNNIANHYQDGKNCERTLKFSGII